MEATQGQSNFKAVPMPDPGSYAARCWAVVHIGKVPKVFNGKVDGVVDMVWIGWELPTEQTEFQEGKGKQPFSVGQEYSLSTADKSNLSKLIKQWRNKPFTEQEKKSFNPEVMLNKQCLLQVSVDKKSKYKGQEVDKITNETHALNMVGIGIVPKGVEVPPMINKPLYFDWDKPFDREVFIRIPRYIRKKMSESEQFKKLGYSLEELEKSTNTVQNGAASSNDSGGW